MILMATDITRIDENADASDCAPSVWWGNRALNIPEWVLKDTKCPWWKQHLHFADWNWSFDDRNPSNFNQPDHFQIDLDELKQTRSLPILVTCRERVQKCWEFALHLDFIKIPKFALGKDFSYLFPIAFQIGLRSLQLDRLCQCRFLVNKTWKEVQPKAEDDLILWSLDVSKHFYPRKKRKRLLF